MKKLLLLTLLFLSACQKENVDSSLKEIQIIVQDEMNNQLIFEEKFETYTNDLESLLIEIEALNATLKAGPYGDYIVEMLNLEEGEGYYWVYESDNNETCLKMGMCPVLKEVELKTGDIFTFKYTNTFN